MKGLGRDEKSFAVYCEQLFDLIARKFIRGGSFSYQKAKVCQISADYERGSPPDLHLVETVLLELGPVVLPANQGTARKMLCLGSCCGKPLSPFHVKSLEPYDTGRRAFLGYEARPASTDPEIAEAEQVVAGLEEERETLIGDIRSAGCALLRAGAR
jgi:hypothetical protein